MLKILLPMGILLKEIEYIYALNTFIISLTVYELNNHIRFY